MEDGSLESSRGLSVVSYSPDKHVLKPETTKRNERNETIETSEINPPKQAKQSKTKNRCDKYDTKDQNKTTSQQKTELFYI